MGELAQHHQTAELGGPSGLLADWTRDSDIVQRGAATFVEVGHALRRIRASGSYRAAGYETFEAATLALTGHGYHQARNLLRATEVVERLAASADVGGVPVRELSERALRPVAALPEAIQAEALRRAEQLRVDEGASVITNQHTQAAVAELREELGGKAPRGKGEPMLDGHDSDEVGTPPEVIEAARALMDGITFDPFSSSAFDRVVGANTFLTRDASAFVESSWWGLEEMLVAEGREEELAAGQWWVNPPYSRASEAVAVVLAKLSNPMWVNAECCILLNTDTGTQAHHELLRRCSAVVLFEGRLDWWWPRPDGTKHTGGGGRASQILYYLGPRLPAEVHRRFGALGQVLVPFRPPAPPRGKGPEKPPAAKRSKPKAEGSNEAPPRRTIAELDLDQYRALAAGLEVEVSWPGGATGTDSRRGRFERVTSKGSVGVRLYHVTPKGEVTERLGSVRWFPPSEVCLLERPRGRKRG